MSEEKTLTGPQLRAIDALLTSGNIGEAAIAAGVNRRTLDRWRREDAFVAALREAEADAVAGLSRNLAGLGDGAAAALRDALDSGEKMSTRLRAAEIVIGNLLKLRELVELEERIGALEAQLGKTD